MHRMTRIGAVLGLVAMGLSATFIVSADDAKLTIKEIMEKSHKGKEAPVQSLIGGKADEATLKQFLEYYGLMVNQKPPIGDEAGWKKKVTALIDATQGLIDKKPNAAAVFKKAVDCKSCHTAYKPRK